MTNNRDDGVVTVCAACKSEACWRGEFYCEDYKTAGTIEVNRAPTNDNRDDGRREYTGPLPPSIDRLVRAAKVVLDQIPDIRPACFDGRELQELARAAAFWDQPTHRNRSGYCKECRATALPGATRCLSCGGATTENLPRIRGQ